MPDQENDRASPRQRARRRPKKAFAQLKALLSLARGRRSADLTEDHVISILLARRGREAVFGPNLFAEPAWDALLELYAAKLGARRVSLVDLAKALAIPKSTIARWIDVLTDRRLVEFRSDLLEPERQWLSLTKEGEAKMKRLTDHWSAAFRSI